MYGTQCNDTISNIVFIRMFCTLFSNRMIRFFSLFSVNCSQVAIFQIINNASLVSARTGGERRQRRGGGGGGQPNVARPGQVEGVGVQKFPNLCGYLLWMTPYNSTEIFRFTYFFMRFKLIFCSKRKTTIRAIKGTFVLKSFHVIMQIIFFNCKIMPPFFLIKNH